MSEHKPLDLPPELQARLDAAGVTDEASLMAALQADPQLRTDFQTFVAAHQEEIFQAVWHEFVMVNNLEELQTLAQQSPFVLEAEFLTTVEQEIARAEESGQPVLADGLRQRLAALRELRGQVSTELPPLAQALMDFIQAPSEAAARSIFADRRDLLLPAEAQHTLDAQFRSEDPEVQQLITDRSRLLQELRAAEQPSTVEPAATPVATEQRRAALLAALAEAEADLQRDLSAVPLDYAIAQNNRAAALYRLAALPDEDRRTRLRDALAGAREAFARFGQLQHEEYRKKSQDLLLHIRGAAGEDFDTIWAELGAEPCPAWLREGQMPEGELDSRLANLLVAFLNTHDLAQMRQLLEAYPALLTDAVEPVFAVLLQQYADDTAAVKTLRDRQTLLQTCREQGMEPVFASLTQVSGSLAQVQRFEQALNSFIDQRNAAAGNPTDITGWQQATAAGEALLQPPLSETPELDLPALQAEVARTYNELGNALDGVQDHRAALAAYERAIELQPDFAMWHRNRAGMLIELRQLDAAAEAIAQARVLEPDVPRLGELETELARAREA
jgi:tetratricopeptide (TPR) repeat protein